MSLSRRGGRRRKPHDPTPRRPAAHTGYHRMAQPGAGSPVRQPKRRPGGPRQGAAGSSRRGLLHRGRPGCRTPLGRCGGPPGGSLQSRRTSRPGPPECERILREFHRTPDREQDGTATWSLTTLQRVLRAAPDGLPAVSTATILQVLWEAGYTWQRDRTWCSTGTVRRKRKAGVVTVVDPDAAPKKS